MKGTNNEALLDYGAVLNLISRDLFTSLSLKFGKKNLGLTIADGHKAHDIERIYDARATFCKLHISMAIFDIKNPPLDVQYSSVFHLWTCNENA